MKQLRQFLMLLTTLLVSQSAMAEYYGLKVGGVSVTSENCSNITGEHIKPWLDGYISTCSYNPETKTLTLGNISIVRSGSGNRAILNESCDGLTIRFVNPCQLSATNASPLRLNANTTITSIPMDVTNVSGYWGFSIYIEGDYEDAITIGNGARFEIKDCTNMKIEADRSSGIVGNTGAEMLTIINSDIKIYRPETYTAQPTWAGIKNLLSVFAENSTVYIDYSHQAVFNVFNFYLSSDMVAKADQWINIAITATFDSTMKTFYYMDGDRAREIYELLLVPSVPIDEEHFPDENFRAYIKEAKDTWPTDGKLDQQEAALYTDISGNKSYYIAIDAPERGISSLKGLEYFPKLELLNVGENNLTELDLTPCPQLKTVYCHRNQLTSLNMANNKSLETLWCYNNQLTSLNLTNCNSLRSLICENNNFTGLDFSHCSSLRGVYIGGNRIDSWMTETLESLPTIPEEEFAQIHITALIPVNSENTCTQAQADIARQKGWEVILDNIDGDGNMYYPIRIAGQAITSANRDDLTVLHYITKNHDSGYAYYDNMNNVLHLSGVDIVLPDSIQSDAINVSTKKDFTIQLGWKPVNIVTNHNSSDGILFEETDYTFNITSEDGETTSELNVTTQDISIHTYSSLVIGGYAKVTLASKQRIALYCTTCDLTMKEHAELMLGHSIMPLRMTGDSTFGDVNLEDGIGIVSPVGARYDKSQGIIVDKDGNEVTGEVLFGQPKDYDLYIAGTRVNTSNLSDVLGDGGSVCFNGIDKLTLKNANIDGGTSQYGIDARFPIDILLEGENNVNGYWGIVFVGESHIKGPGSLNVSGSRGIVFNSPVIFIEDSAQVSVEGTERHAIAKRNSSSEEVVIRGSETFVRLKGVYGAVDIKRLTLEDDLQIALPKGAYFKDEYDGIVRMGSVTPVTIKKEWVTIANQDFADANNKDADGNIIYNIAFAGDTITSAIAADLTVLPAISLNTEGGYARYDATDNSLHLSGVDIEVDADTKAHALDISTFRDATIVLGKDPVNIHSDYYDSSDLTIGIQGLHRSGNQQSLLTITTEEGAEQDGSLTISTQGNSFVAECGVTIAGKAKVSLESARKSAFSLLEAGGKNLTLKEDAGLTLTAIQEPMWMTYNCQLVMEDYIGILQPFGTTYSEDKRSLVDANGTRLSNTTVVFGKRQGYGIYVAGIEVNNINQTDVLGDGTVSYDPDTQTLTLNGANIDGGADNYGIFAYVPFTIMLEGENSLQGVNGINTSEQTTITGTGSLYCLGETGILSSAPGITIEGGAHVKAEGTTDYGMGRKNASAGGITVRGEETVVEMKGMESPYDFNSLTLEDGLDFALPQRARFDVPKGCIVYWWGSAVTLDWVVIRKFQAYNLFVDGTQVTDINQADVLGDGTVSYDPETNTLTLTNANIETDDSYVINAESMPGLSIKLVGENILTGAEDGIRFSTLEPSTIEGPGTLQVSGGVGIRGDKFTICGGANVTVEGTSRWAIFGQLTVSGEETVVAMKSAESAYYGSSLTLNDGLGIVQPQGARFDSDEKGILDAEGNLVKDEWVVIRKFQAYNLFVAGTQVTDINQADVLGDGTVSFDPKMNILTLNGASISSEIWDGITTTLDELSILLEGENSITSDNYYAIEANAVLIKGSGSLECSGTYGIWARDLTITAGAQVKADGMGRGIYARSVTISGTETVVMARASFEEDGFATTPLSTDNLTLEDGLIIGMPEGAYYNSVTGLVVDAEGNYIIGEWLVICSQDYIDGIKDLKDSKDLNDSTYNLAGQKVGSGYKGIVISNGKKLIK